MRSARLIVSIPTNANGQDRLRIAPQGNGSGQVGVQGTRFSEKEKNDVIEVSTLERVQLRQ